MEIWVLNFGKANYISFIGELVDFKLKWDFVLGAF